LAAVEANGMLYVGGYFSQIGPRTGAFAAVSPATGTPAKPFPYFGGTVSCAVPDGQGGVYVGGTFITSGSVATTNLAHLRLDQTLDPAFTFTIDGGVAALATYNNQLVVGGTFGQVNGQSRSNLVVVELVAAQVGPFALGIDGPVQVLAVTSNLLYVGGTFTHVGGTDRPYLAAVDLTAQSLTAWDPSPNSHFHYGITGMVSADSRVYVSGDFDQIAQTTRNQLAAFDATTGVLLDWDAQASNSYWIQTLAVSTNAVYVAGNFTGLGGQPRSALAALDKATGSALPWNPGVLYGVYALAVSGNTVYVGGDFPSVATNGPPRLAAVDAVSGASLPWTPAPGGVVLTILPMGDWVYVGGGFDSAAGVNRQVLAAVDLVSGAPAAWNAGMGADASAGSFVWALAANEDTLFIGGWFWGIGGELRSSLGSARLSDGSVLPFDPGLSPDPPGDVQVSSLCLAGTNLIVNGSLLLDTVVGQRVEWNLGTDGPIYSFAAANGALYVGGDFAHAGGQSRSGLAAFDVNTYELLPWSPSVDGPVGILLVRDQTIIAYGAFQNANGLPCTNIAAFDMVSGDLALGPRALTTDAAVQSLTVGDGALYLAGGFSEVNQAPRGYFAAVDLLTSQTRPWNAGISSTAPGITARGSQTVATPGRIIITGTFDAIGGASRMGLAAFDVTNPPPVVQILTPANNTVLRAPAQVPLAIQAVSPSSSIARLELYSRTDLAISSTNAPFATNWPAPMHVGDYLLTAVAYDQYGEPGLSPAARITVLTPIGYTSPSLAITFPSNNMICTFSNVTVQTTVSAPDSAIEHVQFYLGTNLAATVTNPPFSVTLSNLALGSYTLTACLQDQFGIRVTNGPIAFIVTKPPPLVTNTPASFALPAGTNVILNVFALGDPPITYQWQFQGTNIPGATHLSLVVTNVQAATTGAYAVVVSNMFGAATDILYTITALASAPVIYQQPSSQAFIPGSDVVLYALACGTDPMWYQWSYNGGAIPWATNVVLSLTNLGAAGAGPYSLEISNALGTATSSVASLVVGNPYPGQVDWPSLTLTQAVPSTFQSPCCLAHAADGNGRLFVVEQYGRIWIVQGGAVLPEPFLVIAGNVLVGEEQGLLGLAFPPGFATNGHFYVNYTRRPDSATVISRFSLTPDLNVADTNSEEVLLVIAQPYTNDKGGQLAFGPDGYLYIGMGDGGQVNPGFAYNLGDPHNNGQNPEALLGKVLRIDVESGVSPYRVPRDNPFIGNTNYAPEVWALGLRNPWSFSFDRGTGDLYIGDAGEYRYGSIYFQPHASGGGQNYGWAIIEGPVTYHVPPGFTNFAEFTPPVFSSPAAVWIAGGRVYRGPNEPRMNGIYFLGDVSSGRLLGLEQTATNWNSLQLLSGPAWLGAFGEDDLGNLYLAEDAYGKVYRVQDSHQVWAPGFTPPGGAVYSNTVTVTCQTPAAAIHYTTDGRDPTEFDPAVLSGGTLQVNDAALMKIQALRPDLAPSPVVNASFVLTVAPLVFTPAEGPITNGTTISISCATPGATIYYTLDGSTPTTNSAVYTGPLTIQGGATVSAQAFETAYVNSAVLGVSYPLVQTPTPVFSKPPGALVYGTTVSLSCGTPEAVIYYTLNGTTPTTNSTVYSAPFAILGDVTVSAFAVAPGHLASAVTNAAYTLPMVAAPTFDPPQGPVTNGTLISISCTTTGAVIRYTVDGSTPDTNSPTYSAPLVFSGPFTLSARGYAPLMDPSEPSVAFFGLLDFKSTVVTTFAGTTAHGFLDGMGCLAQFSSPEGICIDHGGNLFVADTGNNVIRKILPSGLVTTFAGTNGEFAGPTGVCLDDAGNLYVADSGHCNRICKVDTNGIVTTFAMVTDCWSGPSLWQLSMGPDGNLYVGYWAALIKVLADGTAFPIAGTGCNCPGGWALDIGPGVDAGTNVYSASGAFLWKTAADGSTELFSGGIPNFSDGPRLLAGFYCLEDVAVDGATNIFLADDLAIRNISPDGWVSTLAGVGLPGHTNGRGYEAQFNGAASLCVDTNGNIFFADSGNNCIRKVSPDSAGIGIADDWQLAYFGHIGIDPSAETGHNGMSNYAEFWAGLDPLDPNSVLAINCSSLLSGGQFQVRWQTVAGKTYTVQYSSDLISWSNLGNAVVGDGSVASVTDSVHTPAGKQTFYRIWLNGF
jgi:glucose/arabinose dehydrogenase